MEPFYSQRLLATPLKPKPAATIAGKQYSTLPLEIIVTTEVTVTYEKRTRQNEEPLLSSFVTAVKQSSDVDTEKNASDEPLVGGEDVAGESKAPKKKKKKNNKCRKNKKKGEVGGDNSEASGSGAGAVGDGTKDNVRVGSSGLADEASSQDTAGGDGMW